VAILPLLSRRLQFLIPLGLNLLLMPMKTSAISWKTPRSRSLKITQSLG